MDGEAPDRTVRLDAPDRTVPVRYPAAVQPRPAGPVPVVPAAVRPPAAVARPVARPGQPPPARTRRLALVAADLSLTQVVCWQVAALAIVGTVGQPWPALLSALLGAAIVLGLTGIRVRGRWGYEVAGAGVRFLLRGRTHELPEPDGKASALLELLLAGATAQTVRAGGHAALAIGSARGLTAVIRPRSPTAGLVASFPAPVTLLGPQGSQPEHGVQVVIHAGATAGSPVRLWVAVHAARTVETALDEELTLVLHNALRRIQRSLKRAGVPTEPLPEEAVFAAVTALAHVTGGRNRVREDWRYLRTGSVSQACFALPGWDRLDSRDAARLIPRLLGRPAGVATSLTLSARCTAGGTRSHALLRLAATTEAAVELTAGGLAGLLAPAGVGLTRLDGGHLPGLAASLPIGEFLR